MRNRRDYIHNIALLGLRYLRSYWKLLALIFIYESQINKYLYIDQKIYMARFVRQADSMKWANFVNDPAVNVLTFADMDIPLF